MNRHVMKAMAPFTEPSSNVPELKGFELDWERVFGPEVLRDDDETTSRGGPAAPRLAGRARRRGRGLTGWDSGTTSTRSASRHWHAS